MEITLEENILMWLRTTYQSGDNQQIMEAHHSLLNFMLADTSQSFSRLQKLLESTNPDIDYNCKKAMVNLLRVSGRQILKIICEIDNESETQKYKKIMFAAEHMFDNLKIESSLKLQIGEVYVSFFNYFTPDSSRLIGKCRYFFNIKEEMQAIGLIQVYHHGKSPFKFRAVFYQAALETLLQNLYKKLNNLLKLTNGAISQISVKDIQIISKYLQIIRQIWVDQGFQKYESVFTNILGKPVFNDIIYIFNSHQWAGKLTSPIYDILAITASSLGRCNLFPKYNGLVQQLESIGKKILDQYLLQPSTYSDNECLSKLNFLIVVIQYKIVSCNLNCFSLFSQMIYPNYKCIQKYLSHNADNQEEIFNFLEDCSFQMESDCVSTKRNKLLTVMCRTSTECASSLRAIIYSFLYGHLPRISGGDVTVIPVNYSLKSGEQLWASVNEKIDPVEQTKCTLLVSALQVGIFMQDKPFLNYFQKFVESNFSFLLEKNPQIVFYTILVYRNYVDDIFGTPACVSFRIRLMRHILDPQQSIIKHFGIYVLKQHISRQIPFEAVDYQVTQVMNFMSTDFTESLFSLVILIFKQYGAQLKQEQAITVVSKCFQLWVSKNGNLECLGLQLLSNFCGIQSCKEHYDDFMNNLLRVANEQLDLIQKYSDQFLGMLSKGLKTIGHLPQDFQSIVMRLNLQIKNNQIMESLNSFIGYSRNELFFNWLCDLITRSDIDIRATLLIHSLIYFGHTYLTIRNIRKIVEATYISRVMGDSHFNYHNGKLNLVFVLLFRYREHDINRLLIQDDWTELREEVNRKRQLQNLLTKETWRGRSSFADEIYQLVYKAQNVYRWKYDIEVFLINQLWLLRHNLSDNMQLRYANLSFVACFTNILRAHQISRSPNEGSDCDSDDSLHRKTQIQKKKRAAKKILANYSVPVEFTKANYLSQYKQLIYYLKKEENGKKWVETILQKLLYNNPNKTQIYNQLMALENINGVFRKIRKYRSSSPKP